METLELNVVTPERVVFSDRVQVLVVMGVEGELGILPDHTPLVTPLKSSVMYFKQEGKKYPVALSGGGYLEVTPSSATIITDAAEFPREIDTARAQAAKERAQERLGDSFPDIDAARAEAALRRAQVRLKALEWE